MLDAVLWMCVAFFMASDIQNSTFCAKKCSNVLLIEKMYLILRRILSKVRNNIN